MPALESIERGWYSYTGLPETDMYFEVFVVGQDSEGNVVYEVEPGNYESQRARTFELSYTFVRSE